MKTKNTSNYHQKSTAVDRWIHWASRKLAGFTLVELIVVITILVILGTIAFLNLGNFSSGARDSGRVSDLANIEKGLDLLFVKNGVILPPDLGTSAGVINLYASWVLIGQQWSIGSTILSAIKMGGDGKDPVDKKSYTYLVNTDRTKYQLLALLEDSATITSFVPSTYADYSARYPTTKGSSLGVLLGSTGATLNQPVQENYSTSTFTGVEIFTATGGLYNAVLSSKSILSGTGNALLPMVANLDTSARTYPGCDTPNIRLPNGQIWAACNVGATQAWGSQTISTSCGWSTMSCKSVLGAYFQWGRNEDITMLSTGSTIASTGTTASALLNQFVINTSGTNDWIASSNDNLWGGSGTTVTSGTYLSQWSPAAMQWSCASWYHVPTINEWCNAFLSIYPGLTCNGAWYPNTSIATILKLPPNGLRWESVGSYGQQGSYGYYWAASPLAGYTSYGAYIMIDPTLRVNPLTGYVRTRGIGIRCLKN